VALLQTRIKRPMIITDLPGKYAFLGLPCHADLVPRIGPLGGIYTALYHADRSHCLVLACDLPFVTPEIIALLCDRAPDHDVVAVDAGNGLEPLCAVYSRACLPAIERQLAQQRYKVTDFYPQVDVTVVELQQAVPGADGETFLNLNTPEDLARARERLRKP
jgi:molybdopterin-guanine dinucleotide biosynthesis protein A